MTNADGTDQDAAATRAAADLVIGFIGLGRMGAPMATNVARGGFPVVLHNRRREVADALAGTIAALAPSGGRASVAATPREVARQADVVITMLADEAALFSVFEGPEGVLAGLRTGTIVVDMGTTGPGGIERLAPLVAATGATLMDAPVSGSTSIATAGSLTLMVGGGAEDLARIQPVLETMATSIYHLGPIGAGSVVKLAVNNIIFALGNAVAESLVLAERAGLDRAKVYEVFENSAVSAPMVRYRHDAYLDPERTPPALAMHLAHKDLELIAELAERVGMPMRQSDLNRSMIADAMAAGFVEQDMADVAVHLRLLAGGH
jgi:3-hydroxyisobutyrate dehydrogenase-like beta-hydroxyacid dehydrogenase